MASRYSAATIFFAVAGMQTASGAVPWRRSGGGCELMRDICFKLVLLVGFFSAFFGCRSTKPDVKPNPPPPEEFKLPPNENRYQDFTAYPKDPLDQSILKRKDNSPGTGVMGSPGAGGMRGQ